MASTQSKRDGLGLQRLEVSVVNERNVISCPVSMFTEKKRKSVTSGVLVLLPMNERMVLVRIGSSYS